MPPLPTEARELHARACYLGARLELKDLPAGSLLADSPHALRVGRGYAFLHRFGVVVMFGLDDVEQAATLSNLAARVIQPVEAPVWDDLRVRVEPGGPDRVDPDGTVVLADDDTDRLQVVANALAKSTALAHFEARVAKAVDHVEALARALAAGTLPAGDRELLEQIGDVLLVQTSTVGRVEVLEKPEAIWDAPALDKLYERLAAELELRARDVALDRKLHVVADTAETYLDLLHTGRGHRLEKYVLLLIAFEIVLSLLEMFVLP